MTTDITMEEIVRLNAARTQGEWYTMAGGPRIELGDTGTIYDEGGHTESDAEFIAAAPRIAAKAIALDKVNKELVEALREIRKIADNSEGILEMVTEALTKAEAL